MRSSSIRAGALASIAALTALACGACRAPVEGGPDPSASAASARAPAPVAASSASAVAKAAPPAKPLRKRPRNELELPTTPASAFFENLDAQIASVARLAHADGKSLPTWKLLVSLHLVRGKHRGDVEEIAVAREEATRCVLVLDSKDPEVYLLRADAERSLGRTKAARADVERARRVGAEADAVAAIEQELDWDEGIYDKAATSIEQMAAAHRTPTTLARLAKLHHDMGRTDDADRTFDEAEDLLVDNNPIPAASLEMQRGRHLLAVGRLDEALLFLRESWRRSPVCIATLASLANALLLTGAAGGDEALRLYEDAARRSSDPDVLGGLGRLLRARGRIGEADALKWRAMWKLNGLLSRFPEATYARAASFFVDEGGEPPRAVELLRKDAALRPTSAAWVALARAQLATGHAAEARESIDKALALPPVSALRDWTAARAYALVGDDARARELSANARAMNPIIDRIEPPLVPAGSVAPAR